MLWESEEGAVVIDSVGNVTDSDFALFQMDPQLPESLNHRTEKLATNRVYHFVRFQVFFPPPKCV